MDELLQQWIYLWDVVSFHALPCDDRNDVLLTKIHDNLNLSTGII